MSDSPEPAVLRKGALASSLRASWSYLVTLLVIMTWYERVGRLRFLFVHELVVSGYSARDRVVVRACWTEEAGKISWVGAA